MHFVEHIVDCHFIITLWYWFHMSSYSCTDGDVMLDASILRLVKHTSPNWLTSCSPIVRISLLITANLQIFPDSRFHRYTSINNHSNFDSNSTMTIHLAIQSEFANSLPWFTTINRTSHINYSKSNVYGDIIPIWLPAYFPCRHIAAPMVMRCSLLHVLYGLVLMSTYWFISCSPIVRSCRRRYLCHLLSLLIISVKSFLEQDAHSINYHWLLHLLDMNSWWQYAKDHRISHM